MRAMLLSLLLSITLASAQTASPPRPKKILTPEQTAYQAALKDYSAQADAIRARAKSAYAAEIAREKAPECPDAENNFDGMMCLSHENDLTAANMSAFTSALRELLALPAPQMPGVTYPITGPTGPEATPATDTAALNAAEISWQAYAKAECGAADVHWRGGTIVNQIIGECNLRNTRARLHELVAVYGSELRIE